MKANTLLYSLLLLLTLSSCEQVIDYDLKRTDSKLVIEGLVTDQPGPYTVRITNTQGYLVQGANAGVSGAAVFITDSQGHTDTLRDMGSGNYQTTTLQGTVGNTYTLKAIVNGETYTAQSLLRSVAAIDSLTFAYKKDEPFFPDGYYTTLYFQEPKGLGDYYKFDIWINDTLQADLTVINDDLYDGSYGDPEIGYVLEPGDKIKTAMYSLDRPGYNFWIGLQTIRYQGGSPFDSPPANAPTNLSNGATGYFGASAVSVREAVVP